MTEKERMKAGLLYDPGDEEVLNEQRPFGEKLRAFNDLKPSQHEEIQRYTKELFS